MAAKKKPGRPRKAVEERRRNRETLTFTDDEHEALRQFAGFGSIAVYCREVILRHLAAKRRKR